MRLDLWCVLSEPERQELAREVLPVLLTTRAGLAEIDVTLRDLSDDEVAAIITEGLRVARAHGRP